ncbi:MAG: hypothetical protein HC854_08210 [Flavobacterium sp.]|nr:hypothetical protein [Flavobacterium sp.]
MLYTSSEAVGVSTVAVLVFVKAILGINKPSLVDVTSNAPLGVVVPIPT